MIQRSEERVAVYAGSFNPMTVGHLDIISRALCLFDKVVVAVGCNIRKPGDEKLAAANAAHIRKLMRSVARVEVVQYNGLTAEVVRECGACCIIRGVRSASDFDYERAMADANAKVEGVETVMLCADPAYSYVSSSMVRELQHFGCDVSQFLVTEEMVGDRL